MKYRIFVVITLLCALVHGVVGQDKDGVLAPTPLAVKEIGPGGSIDWHPLTNTLALLVEADTQVVRDNFDVEVTLWHPIDGADRPQISSTFTQNLAAVDSNVLIFAYSPDGTQLATLSPDQLSIVEATSGRILAQREGAPVGFLEWSPESTRVAVVSTVDYYSLDIVDASTGETQTYRFFREAPTQAGAVLLNATWSNESEIAVAGAGGYRAIINLESDTVTRIDDCCSEAAYELKWQPGGRLLATHDRVYDVDTRQVVFYFPYQSRVFWSPDGQRLIGISPDDEISLISLAEQQVVLRFSIAQLGEGHSIIYADWSRDGAYIALTTNTLTSNGTNSIYRNFVSVWDVGALAKEAGFTLGD